MSFTEPPPVALLPNDDIFVVSKQLNHVLTTIGYDVNNERLKNIETECDHHNFKSSEAYILHIRKTMKKLHQSRETKPFIYKQIMSGMASISKIGYGWCQNCALIITSTIYKLIDDNTRTYYRKLNISKPNIIMTQQQMLIISFYFVNSVYYPCFAKFMFHQSEYLWVGIFDALYFSMEMARRCYVDGHETECYSDRYTAICMLSTAILRNIHLLKAAHWEKLCALDIDRGYSYLDTWLGFMEQELKYRNYLQCKGGMAMMHCLFVFITMSLHTLKQQKNKSEIKKLMRWIGKIEKGEKYVNKHVMSDVIPKSLAILKNEPDNDTLYDMFKQSGKQIWSRKWQDMKCQNVGCNVQRKYGKLYKCKKCKCARYCSRKCQKIDWNRNQHKKYCKKLKKIRRGK